MSRKPTSCGCSLTSAVWNSTLFVTSCAAAARHFVFCFSSKRVEESESEPASERKTPVPPGMDASMEASASAALLDRPLAPPATLTPVADAGDRSTAFSRLGTPRPAPRVVGIGANGAPTSDDSSDVLSPASLADGVLPGSVSMAPALPSSAQSDWLSLPDLSRVSFGRDPPKGGELRITPPTTGQAVLGYFRTRLASLAPIRHVLALIATCSFTALLATPGAAPVLASHTAFTSLLNLTPARIDPIWHAMDMHFLSAGY